MRYEVRKTGGPACPSCGATELVLDARNATELTADVAAYLEGLTPPWWRPFARRRLKQLAALHAEAAERLRKHTYLV